MAILNYNQGTNGWNFGRSYACKSFHASPFHLVQRHVISRRSEEAHANPCHTKALPTRVHQPLICTPNGLSHNQFCTLYWRKMNNLHFLMTFHAQFWLLMHASKGILNLPISKSSPLFTFSTKSLGQDSPSVHLLSIAIGLDSPPQK